MYLCLCKTITETEVEQLGRAGVVGAADLIEVLGLDDDLCCGRCAIEIEEFQAVALAAQAEGAHLLGPTAPNSGELAQIGGAR
ncbi:MAG: bacterioferritin-associated ferredoxin [Chloroflexota bacterium]|jgi:bacterioferritin-associated ferredoxin|nr:bacterioferritin-associated ferredoxin [Chloroflexota bacterium]